MSGTVIITGANGSLALGFVKSFLSEYPQRTLVATVRNQSPEKDPNTANLLRLVNEYPEANFYLEALDLGSLAGVRSFAEKLSARIASKELPRILGIVCNASTWSLQSGQKFTLDNYEATFQVCHLSHYLLVLKLLSSMDTKSGRIVMLGSITHYPDKPNPLSSLGPCFPDDFEELVKPTLDPTNLVHDRGFQRYATAKLANVTFANDLNKRLQKDLKLSNITVTAMDPGGLPSSRAQAGQKRSTRFLMGAINFLMPVLKHCTTLFRTTEDAGRDLATVSSDPTFTGKRGYYVGIKTDFAAPVSQDPGIQKKLWECCWRWAGLTPADTPLKNIV
ncbi:hypothetical protein N7462_008001 [Penicillium macrosclerotiorum]|uniref:uncharacterized protein n=1 Tax=Penicillium macrosclerotiorum TaxID=303699 RepID=UPI002546B48E|nr:uncharacterized protein N7462_008001 [Penicillium macrosclerotiorum]KAJ5679757.1 hypothetical protein N7462_008001 [Penicillium macrosclerotiorum]